MITQLELMTLARNNGWRKRELGYSIAWHRAFALTRKGQKLIVEFDANGQLESAVSAGWYIDDPVALIVEATH